MLYNILFILFTRHFVIERLFIIRYNIIQLGSESKPNSCGISILMADFHSHLPVVVSYCF